MDVFAHTLWTNALFHLKYHNQRRMRYLAAFFGVVPDLVGFAPLFIYLVISGQMFRGGEFHLFGSHWTYLFAEHAYNYTHSLVIFSFAFLLVHLVGNIYLKIKNGLLYRSWFFWPMLGWALHILIDIPSHPDFYRTPVFFPLSDAHFSHGVRWSHPTYMLVNYTLLVLTYIGLYFYQKRKNERKSKK